MRYGREPPAGGYLERRDIFPTPTVLSPVDAETDGRKEKDENLEGDGHERKSTFM